MRATVNREWLKQTRDVLKATFDGLINAYPAHVRATQGQEWDGLWRSGSVMGEADAKIKELDRLIDALQNEPPQPEVQINGLVWE